RSVLTAKPATEHHLEPGGDLRRLRSRSALRNDFTLQLVGGCGRGRCLRCMAAYRALAGAIPPRLPRYCGRLTGGDVVLSDRTATRVGLASAGADRRPHRQESLLRPAVVLGRAGRG